MSPEDVARFKRASGLYREGNYAESLALLRDLRARYPEDKEITYGLALARIKVGQDAEAADLVWELQTKFDDPRVPGLLERLAARRRDRLAETAAVVPSVTEPPPLATAPPPIPASENSDLGSVFQTVGTFGCSVVVGVFLTALLTSTTGLEPSAGLATFVCFIVYSALRNAAK